MKDTRTRNIVAIVTVDKDVIIDGGVPCFMAKDKEEQEKIASVLGRTLGGNIYGLVNGVIIITQE